MMPDSNAVEWRWRLARQYWGIGYLLEDGDLGVMDDRGYGSNDTVPVTIKATGESAWTTVSTTPIQSTLNAAFNIHRNLPVIQPYIQ